LNQFPTSITEWKILLSGKDLKTTLIRDGMGSLLLKAGYIFLSFGTTVILARSMGAERYGVYSYIFALVSLIAIPTQFGLPTLVVRETAQAMARKEYGLVRGVWSWSGKFVLVSTVVLIGIAVIGVFLFGSRFSTEDVSIFYWGLALVALVALSNLRGAALRGLHHVFEGLLPEQLLFPGFFVLLVGAVSFFAKDALVPALAMILQVTAAALAFLIGMVLLWRLMPEDVHNVKPIYKGRHWFFSTLPLALIGGMRVINNRSSLVILGFFVSSADIGTYRTASQMALLVSSGLQAMTMVVAPQFARFYSNKNMLQLQRVATYSARIVFALTLPVVAVFFIWGKPIINLVFGVEFIQAYTPLIILSVGQLVNAAAGSVASLLNMTGNERETAKVLLLSVCLNLLLHLLLVPRMGVNGAAIASTVSITVWNIFLWLAVRRNLKIDSMAFAIFPDPNQDTKK